MLSSLRAERGLPLPGAGHCTRLTDSLQQTIDASKFPTLVWKVTQQPLCMDTPLTDRHFYQNHIFVQNFYHFILLLLILGLDLSQGKV